VEAFADGGLGDADATRATAKTFLSEVRMPPLEEIAGQPEFKPYGISQEEFEAVWERVAASE
jgi:hypothetical protein